MGDASRKIPVREKFPVVVNAPVSEITDPSCFERGTNTTKILVHGTFSSPALERIATTTVSFFSFC